MNNWALPDLCTCVAETNLGQAFDPSDNHMNFRVTAGQPQERSDEHKCGWLALGGACCKSFKGRGNGESPGRRQRAVGRSL